MRCCIGDGGASPWGWWSSATTLQGEVANHREVRRSRAARAERRGKVAPVSAAGVGQEGERKRSTEDVSKGKQEDIETGRNREPGMSLAGACLLARRCPAWRWRELGLGSGAERVNLSSRWGGWPVERLWPAAGCLEREPQVADPRGGE